MKVFTIWFLFGGLSEMTTSLQCKTATLRNLNNMPQQIAVVNIWNFTLRHLTFLNISLLWYRDNHPFTPTSPSPQTTKHNKNYYLLSQGFATGSRKHYLWLHLSGHLYRANYKSWTEISFPVPWKISRFQKISLSAAGQNRSFKFFQKRNRQTNTPPP